MKSKNFHATVVDRLAAMIIAREETAGSQLPIEAELCLSMGVSRTVLREAVKTLSAKNMLVTGPRTGTRARPSSEWNTLDPDVLRWRVAAGISQTFIRDIMELRFAIEPKAAKLAAERATTEDIRTLQQAYDAMERGVLKGCGGYLDGDLGFHLGILNAAHNQFFSALKPAVSTLFEISMQFTVKSRELARLALPLHKAVADAIANRVADEAEQAMCILLGTAREVTDNDMVRDDFLLQDGKQDAVA